MGSQMPVDRCLLTSKKHETMSNGSGQNPATTSTDGDKPERSETVHLQNPQSLERLRERVKQAVHELDRLRQENAALAQRLQQLEARPDVDFDGTVITVDADPEALREKVEGFIKTIDAYLAREN